MIKILKTKKKSNGILEKGSAIPIWEIGSISFLLLLHKMKTLPRSVGQVLASQKKDAFPRTRKQRRKGI